MIRGRLASSRRPVVPVAIQDGNSVWQTLLFTLDTGFTGHLALPARYLRQLDLELNESRTISSATEQSVTAPSGYARITWYGNPRDVRVVQAGTQPLLGMALLWDNHIAIDAVADGAVTVTPLGG